MGYIVCDNCGGYYELQQGESAEDFDTCQCGGYLKIKDSAEIYENELHLIEDTLYCINCGNYDSKSVFCSKCGCKLIILDDVNLDFNDSADLKLRDSTFEKAKIVKNINFQEKYPEKRKPILERINVLSIIVGLGCYWISLVIFSTIIMTLTHDVIGFPIFDWIFIFFNVALFIISMISGAITAYVTKKVYYEDILINTGIVALIVMLSVLIIDGFTSFDILLVNILIFTPLGGIAFLFIKQTFFASDNNDS
jgi:hypothetical protein